MTTTVYGRLLLPSGLPVANATVTFTLIPHGVTDAHLLLSSTTAASTDDDGNFSVDLWPNETGATATEYLCTLPNLEKFRFTLPNVDSINISVLRVNDINYSREQQLSLMGAVLKALGPSTSMYEAAEDLQRGTVVALLPNSSITAAIAGTAVFGVVDKTVAARDYTHVISAGSYFDTSLALTPGELVYCDDLGRLTQSGGRVVGLAAQTDTVLVFCYQIDDESANSQWGWSSQRIQEELDGYAELDANGRVAKAQLQHLLADTSATDTTYSSALIDQLLALLQPLTHKDQPNGYVGLDGTSQIARAQMQRLISEIAATDATYASVTIDTLLAQKQGTSEHGYAALDAAERVALVQLQHLISETPGVDTTYASALIEQLFQARSQRNEADGYAGLDATGKVALEQLQHLITNTAASDATYSSATIDTLLAQKQVASDDYVSTNAAGIINAELTPEHGSLLTLVDPALFVLTGASLTVPEMQVRFGDSLLTLGGQTYVVSDGHLHIDYLTNAIVVAAERDHAHFHFAQVRGAQLVVCPQLRKTDDSESIDFSGGTLTLTTVSESINYAAFYSDPSQSPNLLRVSHEVVAPADMLFTVTTITIWGTETQQFTRLRDAEGRGGCISHNGVTYRADNAEFSGTWTPDFGQALTVNSADYVARGGICYINCDVTFAAEPAADLQLAGLPLPPLRGNNAFSYSWESATQLIVNGFYFV